MFPCKDFTLDIHHSDLTDTAKKFRTTFAQEKHIVILKNFQHSLWYVPTVCTLSPAFCFDCFLSHYLNIEYYSLGALFKLFANDMYWLPIAQEVGDNEVSQFLLCHYLICTKWSLAATANC